MRDKVLRPWAHFSFLSRNKCRWSPKKVMTAVVSAEALGVFTVSVCQVYGLKLVVYEALSCYHCMGP